MPDIRADARNRNPLSEPASRSSSASEAPIAGASSSRTAAGAPAGGHPAHRPGTVRHSVGGRQRADHPRSESGSTGGSEDHLFVFIPDEPAQDE